MNANGVNQSCHPLLDKAADISIFSSLFYILYFIFFSFLVFYSIILLFLNSIVLIRYSNLYNKYS